MIENVENRVGQRISTVYQVADGWSGQLAPWLRLLANPSLNRQDVNLPILVMGYKIRGIIVSLRAQSI